MNAMQTIEQEQLRERPDLQPGLTVRVHVKIREGGKERIQVFEGVVISIRRGGPRATFTVRKVSFGQGVERIFPLHSPSIDRIEIGRAARVRRAKLYFLRGLRGRAARLRERLEAVRRASVHYSISHEVGFCAEAWIAGGFGAAAAQVFQGKL